MEKSIRLRLLIFGTVMADRFPCLLAFGLGLVWSDLHAANAAPAATVHIPVAAGERVPRLPEPLAVRD